MEVIEVITTTAVESSLDPTRTFGIILNKSLSIIKMLHWYSLDYDAHKILNKLYEDLSESFDKIQEEIIGTSKEYNLIFPSFNVDLFNLEDINAYKGDLYSIDYYYDTTSKLKEILTCLEFNNYVSSVKSGINNTKDDIITSINKANYLLSMVKA
jgi:DNA-binding ferritin-like protein